MRISTKNHSGPDPAVRQRSPFHRPRFDEGGDDFSIDHVADDLSDKLGRGSWDTEADNQLVRWAVHDAAAAMEWLMTTGDSGGDTYARLLGAIATGILIGEGNGAMMQFIERHQNDDRIPFKHRGELDQYLFRHLGYADTIDSALEAVADRAGDDGAILAGALVLGLDGTHATQRQMRAIDYLEAKGVAVEIDYWSFQHAIAEDPRYWADWAEQRDSALMEEIVQAWNRDDPEEAQTWIDQRFGRSDPRRTRLEELLDQ